MGRTPQEDASNKAKRAMQEAVGKVIDEKQEEIGTKEAEADVAEDLNEAARKDAGKRGRKPREKGEGSGPRIRVGAHCVTQIAVIETEPEKQAEAFSVMTERARFMARQPGFISISVHLSLDQRRIVNYVQWESREQLQSAHKSPEFRKEWTHFDKVTDEIDPHLYEVAEVVVDSRTA
jgi:heme-degrading monooxygenase HmoA